MISIVSTYSTRFDGTTVVPCGWMLGQAGLPANVPALVASCVS